MKISICIPTYNRGYIIERAIRSAIRQDYQDLEILIVDNASDDNTEEIVRKYLNNDNRLRYFRNDTNLGFSGNLIRCVEKALGDVLIFLGDDDVLSPGVASKYGLIFESFPNVGIVLSNKFSIDCNMNIHWVFDSIGETIISDKENISLENSANYLFCSMNLTAFAVRKDKELLNSFRVSTLLYKGYRLSSRLYPQCELAMNILKKNAVCMITEFCSICNAEDNMPTYGLFEDNKYDVTFLGLMPVVMRFFSTHKKKLTRKILYAYIMNLMNYRIRIENILYFLPFWCTAIKVYPSLLICPKLFVSFCISLLPSRVVKMLVNSRKAANVKNKWNKALNEYKRMRSIIEEDAFFPSSYN